MVGTDGDGDGAGDDRSEATGRVRWRGVAAVVVGAALLVGAGVVVWQKMTSDLCSGIPVALADPQPEAIGVVDPQDVLVYERASNFMSGFDQATVVVTANGTAIALADWGPASQGDRYRAAVLHPDTVAALRRCVDSNRFRSIESSYSSGYGRNPNGGFCATTDASNEIVGTGLASSSPRTVSAYALGDGFGLPSCDQGYPAVLVALDAALAQIQRAVAAGGSPTDPPADDLTPR